VAAAAQTVNSICRKHYKKGSIIDSAFNKAYNIDRNKVRIVGGVSHDETISTLIQQNCRLYT
jgi:hypothetical protein